VSTDQLIDEALDYRRAHPSAREEQVRRYLEDLVSGAIGARDATGIRAFWYGPLYMLFQSLFQSRAVAAHADRIDKAMRVVFPTKKEKKEKRADENE
jgi:hypothetical protein